MPCIVDNNCSFVSEYCDGSTCLRTTSLGDPCRSSVYCPYKTECHSSHKRCRQICSPSDTPTYNYKCLYDSSSMKYLLIKENGKCLMDYDCARDSYCDYGLCQFRRGQYSTCSKDFQCSDGLGCDSGVCRKKCNTFLPCSSSSESCQ